MEESPDEGPVSGASGLFRRTHRRRTGKQPAGFAAELQEAAGVDVRIV
jgi:hypothetical protein